jgi:hypothetical protein
MERKSKSFKSRQSKKTTMKNSLKLTFAICCIIIGVKSNAQISFGLKAGLNLSTMTDKLGGMSIDPKTLVGFNVGVISEITLKDNLFLQPGIFYSTKGSKYSLNNMNATVTPNYLDIPVNVLYKFGSGSTKFFIYAGPYIAFALSGKVTNMDNSTADIHFGSGDKEDMRSTDFGLNFGAGVDISHFQISAQYGIGLENLAPVTTNGAEMKSTVIGISIGYLFRGK